MRKVVIIVDDTESVAFSLAIALENIPGVKTIVAQNPKIALRFFSAPNLRISALVTDFNLPFFNGFELIREIRNLDGYAKLPAVMITADDVAWNAEASDGSSPNIIFRKPFSIKEVCRVLEELLQ
jgi:DNA-binding response OmpR family regulator